MAKIKIAPFQRGQEKIVAHIHNAAFTEWIEKLEKCYAYRYITPQDVTEWCRSLSASIWLAYVKEEPAGYVYYRLELASGQRDFLVMHYDLTHPDWGQSKIAVIPKHRRKGIATALMKACLKDFDAKGGELAMAAAYNDNISAVALLSKVGFINNDLFYFQPYSDQKPWGYDSVYAEIDLTKPLKNLQLNPNVIIRKPRHSDLDAFVTIFCESAPFAFGPEPSHQQITEWMARSDADETMLVAEYEGNVAGVMEFSEDGSIGIPGVLPKYRNKGIGTTLFYHLFKRMQLKNHRKAIGDTGLIQKEMIRMYDRFGFHISRKLLNWAKVI